MIVIIEKELIINGLRRILNLKIVYTSAFSLVLPYKGVTMISFSLIQCFAFFKIINHFTLFTKLFCQIDSMSSHTQLWRARGGVSPFKQIYLPAHFIKGSLQKLFFFNLIAIKNFSSYQVKLGFSFITSKIR